MIIEMVMIVVINQMNYGDDDDNGYDDNSMVMIMIT